jgi:hypothetical protein
MPVALQIHVDDSEKLVTSAFRDDESNRFTKRFLPAFRIRDEAAGFS